MLTSVLLVDVDIRRPTLDLAPSRRLVTIGSLSLFHLTLLQGHNMFGEFSDLGMHEEVAHDRQALLYEPDFV